MRTAIQRSGLKRGGANYANEKGPFKLSEIRQTKAERTKQYYDLIPFVLPFAGILTIWKPIGAENLGFFCHECDTKFKPDGTEYSNSRS